MSVLTWLGSGSSRTRLVLVCFVEQRPCRLFQVRRGRRHRSRRPRFVGLLFRRDTAFLPDFQLPSGDGVLSRAAGAPFAKPLASNLRGLRTFSEIRAIVVLVLRIARRFQKPFVYVATSKGTCWFKSTLVRTNARLENVSDVMPTTHRNLARKEMRRNRASHVEARARGWCPHLLALRSRSLWWIQILALCKLFLTLALFRIIQLQVGILDDRSRAAPYYVSPS